jgi:hypothetical protein
MLREFRSHRHSAGQANTNTPKTDLEATRMSSPCLPERPVYALEKLRTKRDQTISEQVTPSLGVMEPERETRADMVAEPQTWLTHSDGVRYPPAPWHLRGTAYISLWQVRASRLPEACLSRDVRPVTVLGRVLVGTAFAIYEPEGILAYDELLLAVQVRRGVAPSVCMPSIWVDHPASAAGARALWSIPKQEATFAIERNDGAEGSDFEARALTALGASLAHLRFRSRTTMPGRWPVRTTIVQRPLNNGGDHAPQMTEARAWARVSLGAATWDFPRSGPLSFLRGCSPLTSIRLTDMSLRIGSS